MSFKQGHMRLSCTSVSWLKVQGGIEVDLPLWVIFNFLNFFCGICIIVLLVVDESSTDFFFCRTWKIIDFICVNLSPNFFFLTFSFSLSHIECDFSLFSEEDRTTDLLSCCLVCLLSLFSSTDSTLRQTKAPLHITQSWPASDEGWETIIHHGREEKREIGHMGEGLDV